MCSHQNRLTHCHHWTWIAFLSEKVLFGMAHDQRRKVMQQLCSIEIICYYWVQLINPIHTFLAQRKKYRLILPVFFLIVNRHHSPLSPHITSITCCSSASTVNSWFDFGIHEATITAAETQQYFAIRSELATNYTAVFLEMY